MTVLQHYYTSFVNEKTGSSGFQMKAMSSGISPELQARIERLIAYRIPPSCNEHDIHKHPIALRYYYVDKDESILLCTQSCGKDEYGRPGNFFAHTVVLPPENFEIMLPILYWKSPFWLKASRAPDELMQPLSEFDIDPSFETEKIYSFLADRERREQFASLMAAVVHCHSAKRRIVIIDNAETVALWIAALCAMLPPVYRPLLTFATYHHDPYQSPFLVTGTTRDSTFRAVPEDYRIYFVLNGTIKPNIISNVDHSEYAKFINNVINSEIYTETLIPFFTYYTRRFEQREQIDELLDIMAHYAKVIQRPEQKPLSNDELCAVRLALKGFENPQQLYEQEDIDELKIVVEALWISFKHNPALHEDHMRAKKLLQQHEVPTDETIEEEIGQYLKLIGEGEALKYALPGFKNLRRLYGDNVFVDHINRPAHLTLLEQLMTSAAPDLLTTIWKHIGPYLRPGTLTQKVWIVSLATLGRMWDEEKGETDELFYALTKTSSALQCDWLKIAVDENAQLPDSTLLHFYCKLVHPLTLEQRDLYRVIVQPIYKNILYEELWYDMPKRILEDISEISVIKLFMRYVATSHKESVSEIVRQGILLFKELYKESPNWDASLFLSDEDIAPVVRQLPDLERFLVETVFENVTLNPFWPEQKLLYERYRNFSTLSQHQRVVIRGLHAMATGQLGQELVEPLHQYFASLASSDYKLETDSFLSQFMWTDSTYRYHHTLITTVFIRSHRATFWDCYWKAIQQTVSFLTNGAIELLLGLFSFWFKAAPQDFREPYIVQTVFLELPLRLSAIQQDPDVQKTLAQMLSAATQFPWYPVLYEVMSPRRNLFTTMGQSLKTMVSRTKDDPEMVQKKLKMENDVNRLFMEGAVHDYHMRLLSSLTSAEQTELFWLLYWKRFTLLLLEEEAALVLDILKFWFDSAFVGIASTRYFAQQFLLGLGPALEVVRKERNFRKHATSIHNLALKEAKQYPWYDLIQPYFVEQQGNRFGFFKGGFR
jgi:GTPase-associated protein 1, N-terminal domain type 2/GTPase-associated protein 1, middle domain